MKKFSSDIDIDFGNRDAALALLKHHPAGIIRDGKLKKHSSGIYVTDIPVDPMSGTSSIDYKDADDRGYIKLDFLNVSVYEQVKDEAHLLELMHKDPPWDRLYDRDFCSKIIHINDHYDTLIAMPEAVNSIPRLAMFLALIRPAKRHLVGLPWKDVAKTVWDKPAAGEGYGFKKAHGVAYSHLVVVHMNLLIEQEQKKLLDLIV